MELIETKYNINLVLGRLLRTVVWVVFGAHLIACLWHLIGVSDDGPDRCVALPVRALARARAHTLCPCMCVCAHSQLDRAARAEGCGHGGAVHRIVLLGVRHPDNR